jgi:formylglycine-generating enzyme required for sulfatase activity
MERAVISSRKTAVVLTPNYLSSQWASFEQVLAQTLDPAARSRRVIPILLARSALPARLKMLNYVDFTSAPDHDTRLATLVHAIRATRRPKNRGASARAETRRFVDYIQRRYEYLDFKGMGISDRVPLQLRLVDMYVPLSARVELPEGETWSRDLRIAGRPLSRDPGSVGQRLSEPRPVTELLRAYDGVIILGDPGAGKTTFLKYLAVQIALGHGSEFGLEGRLPILLPLSAYAQTLGTRDIPLHDFIADHYRGLGVDLPIRDLLDDALANGDALLLMDGLDEVRDIAQRHLVVDRVLDFFAFHRTVSEHAAARRNKFVLTARIVGYRDVRRSIEDIVECTLVDFGSREIAEFVQKWTAALERAARGQSALAAEAAEREREELLTAIERSPGVRGLAANPLLLTILALMKRQGISLPDRRVELYQKYVETLLKHWNLARSLGRPLSRDLDVTETVKVLAPLALWMHETSAGVGLVKREEMRRRLIEIFATRGIAEPERLADQLLADVRDHAGLLLERGPGQYGFIHLTFQEYLAGAGVALQGQLGVDRVLTTLRNHLREPTWHEVSTLAIAHLGIVQQRDEAASAVVEALLEDTLGEPGAAIALAGEAVADMSPGGILPLTRTRVVDALAATMRDDRRTGAPLRAAAGTALGRIGDPRFREDAWFLPASSRSGQPDPLLGFTKIASGRFWMGSARGTTSRGNEDGPSADLQAYEDEEPAHEIELPTYYIARYPVTVAQFRAFALDTRLDVGDRAIRGLPTHPAVLVSFVDALAYCDWLMEKLCSSPSTPEPLAVLLRNRLSGGESFRVTLPTEPQWEKAARATDGRLFPWGNEIDSNRANFEDTRVGSTSPVGSFMSGASPYGVEDLSGNTWEWTRTLWGRTPATPAYRYPYDASDGREDSAAPADILRVVRGGSYDSGPWNVRSAVRVGLLPIARTRTVGFRLALSAFPE